MNTRNENEPAQPQQVIHVVLEGGVIHQVLHIPPGLQVQFINLDVEGLAEKERQASPLDGQPCHLTTYP